jgi:photosystem II stability/assembly factor-like uncharacterized protein
MTKSILLRVLFLGVLITIVVGTLVAQQSTQPERWSRIYPTGETVTRPPIQEPTLPATIPQGEPRILRVQDGYLRIDPNYRVHPNPIGTQSELSIATHPNNPNIVIGGSNAASWPTVSTLSQGWYITTNGGTSWYGSDTLPPHVIAGLSNYTSDPAVGIDRNGNMYFNTLLYSSSTGDVVTTKSTNNGQTWGNFVAVPNPGPDEDKNHFIIDNNPSSPYSGYLYTAYTEFGSSPNRLEFSRSTDGSATWSAPLVISSGGSADQGVNLQVGPNGELYATYTSYISYPSSSNVGFNKSTDGGATWGTQTSAAGPIADIRGNFTKGGYTIRVSSFPSMAVDKSFGPYRGWIYIFYPAQPGSNPDIYMVKSTNGGTSWSTPMKVNQNTESSRRDQWYPWATVDPSTGHLYVVYYDSRNFANNDSTEVYMSRSINGGATFEDIKVSDHAFLLRPISGLATGYAGDYIGLTALNGTVWPFWNDNSIGTDHHQAWTVKMQFAYNFGFVAGTITNGSNQQPLSGVAVDFVGATVQQTGISDQTGSYKAGAPVDTNTQTQQYTLRAQKFGFLDSLLTVTLTLNDTLHRNFSMTPAPGGTLSVHSRTSTTNLRSYVEVKFGNLVVVSDSTNATTGLLTVPLPMGTYSVRVDAPSPYRTLNYPSVVITENQTTNIDALTQPVVTTNLLAVRDTLIIGQSHGKTLTLTNTSTDSVPWRLSGEPITFANLTDRERAEMARSTQQRPTIEVPKGGTDTEFEPANPDGQGGPDAFGYIWIDSDQPGGPTYNWVEISSIGTQISGWTGSGDEGHVILPVPFAFPFYGSTYNQVKVTTNGFISFDVVSTNHTYTNTTIPASAEPNNNIFPFWDDLDVTSSGGVYYYYDAPNSRYIIQYNNAPHYSSGGPYTFEVILKPSGEILCQYKTMTTPLNSASIGIENSTGTVGLQVVYNSDYVHDNMALLFKVRGIDWLTYTPSTGTLAPGGNQNVAALFNALGLQSGTTYNANTYLDVAHQDVQGSLTLPTSLTVQPADSAVMITSRDSIAFPQIPVNASRMDSFTVRNGGVLTLNVSSLSSTNARFPVTPTSVNVPPLDSVRIRVTYNPNAEGTDTGRIVILSNSQGQYRKDIGLRGSAIGVPHFVGHRNGSVIDSLTKNISAGVRDSILFHTVNNGTGVGVFSARAIMISQPGSERPIIVPVTLEPASSPSNAMAARVLLVSDNAALMTAVSDKGPDPDPMSAAMSPTGVSSSLIYRALVEAGYQVDTVAFATHDPSTYPQYDLVAWVSGATSGSMFVDAAKRTALINRVIAGGKVWVEGGEVGYYYRSTGTIDHNFRRTVLRDSNWISDVSSSSLVLSVPTHPIFTTPNPVSGPIAFTGTSIYTRDAVRLLPGDAGAQKIAGWSTYTSQGPDTAGIIAGMSNGVPNTVFTTFAFGAVTDTATAKKLAQNIASWLVGSGSARWLDMGPTSGTIAVSDSIQMRARFNATELIGQPGNYIGRIEVVATNSPLADTLKIPVRMFVQPAVEPILSVLPDSLNFGSVPLNTTAQRTFLAKNIGGSPLTVTNVASTNARFTPTPTSFTLAPLDTQRVTVTFAPLIAGVQNGMVNFTSNSSVPASVRLVGTGVGQAAIVVRPDTFYYALPAGPDTARSTFFVRNPGTDTLRYAIDEALPTGLEAIARSTQQQEYTELPKDAVDPRSEAANPNGRGGPDAFGYIWIDSDEPGGPTFNWTDISSVGTPISVWTGTADDGYATVDLPFGFSFYGISYTSMNVVTNGFIQFGGGTSTAYSNGAIPSTAVPNNAIYPFWDDLNLTSGGTVYYYNDVANNRFILQFTDVPHYSSGGPYTFQLILKPSGEIVVQYLTMSDPVNSTTIGIENADGTVALQVVYNDVYVHNNMALLFTRDLFSWMSTDRTLGTVAPGDSQAVQLRIHPAGLAGGFHNGRLRVSGNTPNIGLVRVGLQITGVQPTITVTSPNGGEQWVRGTQHAITWLQNEVDSVKLEYSVSGPGGPWTTIIASTPARPRQIVHPKLAVKDEVGGVFYELNGSYNWTIPANIEPTSNAYVRVSWKSNPTVLDLSNAAFSILATAPPETTWTVQSSGVTSQLRGVRVIDQNVAWAAGAGGTVIRTTNGGTSWQSVGGGAIGSNDIYTMDAVSATTAFVSTTPSTTTFIYRTTDGGSSWQQVYSLAGGFMDGIRMADAVNGIAVGDPVGSPLKWVVLQTSDGGATWTRIATEPTPNSSTEAGWNNAFYTMANNQYAWFGTNNNGIWRTTDGGSSWSFAVTTLGGNANCFGIQFNGPPTGTGLAAGQTSGVDRSTNGGANWSAATAAGTGAAFGIAGYVAPSGSPEYWIASSTGSIYYSSNHGTSWVTTGPNGYSGTVQLWHVDMKTTGNGNNIFGWAVGDAGKVLRYRRVSVGVEDGPLPLIPEVFSLDQNYPNPFNPVTTIQYGLPIESRVNLKVYNLLGQEVATLVDGVQAAAYHHVQWNGLNRAGQVVPSGLYFFRIDATPLTGAASSFTQIRKMIMMK